MILRINCDALALLLESGYNNLYWETTGGMSLYIQGGVCYGEGVHRFWSLYLSFVIGEYVNGQMPSRSYDTCINNFPSMSPRFNFCDDCKLTTSISHSISTEY